MKLQLQYNLGKNEWFNYSCNGIHKNIPLLTKIKNSSILKLVLICLNDIIQEA